MKTKLFFVLVISAFLLNACSSSDDSASIVGIWKYNREGSVVDGTEVLTPYSGNQAGCEKDESEFTSNGVIIDTYFTSLCEAVDNPGTYTKSGNTITVTFPDGTFTFTILKLTSTILKVKNVDGYILEFVK
jgi:major membrane immunogen (membrane-anchored lipoprotein)